MLENSSHKTQNIKDQDGNIVTDKEIIAGCGDSTVQTCIKETDIARMNCDSPGMLKSAIKLQKQVGTRSRWQMALSRNT